MQKQSIGVACTLTVAGILPFFLLEMAAVSHLQGFDFQSAFFTYAAVIIAFICGMHWGICFFFSEKKLPQLLLHSNAITLLGWAACCLSSATWALIIQSGCFIYLLGLDVLLHRGGVLPTWFFKLRVMVTAVVVLVFGVGGWFVFV